MIVQKEFLNKLKDFGLNSYESKLWVALLSRGISTAGELSDISNVPRSRAYDVLESLEKKGFIVVKIGKPIKYLAVHPNEVVERVKKRIKAEAVEKNGILDNLKKSEILEELDTLHSTGIKLVDPTDKSASFRGRDKVYEHMNFLIKNAKKSVHLMTTKEGLARKKDALLTQIKKASQRGVNVKVFVPSGVDKKVINSFSQYAKIKATKENSRFCVVDSKGILLLMTDDQKTHPSYDSGVWVEAPHFVNYFTTLFEREWKGRN
jgi:HTH-type transcriptional regulator, sugar sensing transcriptional regulator